MLDALERIVPLSGKRIADVGTGIGHYPMLLARRTGRTYGIESDPELLAEARRRAAEAHQPNIRIVEGGPTSSAAARRAVDVVLTAGIDPEDSLAARRRGGAARAPARAGASSPSATTVVTTSPAARAGGGRGRDGRDPAAHRLVAAERVQDQGRPRSRRLSDPELAHELLPRLYGDRGRAYLMAPHRPSLRLNLGLYHRGPAELAA